MKNKKISFFLIFLIGIVLIDCSIVLGDEKTQKIGVVIFNEKKTDHGYRLYSSRNLTAAHLISPKGRYVHSWYYSHEEDEVTSSFGGFGMTWHYAEMLPNGHLIAIVKDEMIVELDWESNLVWKQRLRAHHDFSRGSEGNTIVISRKDMPNPWWPGNIIAMDELVEYNDESKIVWKWRYADHYKDQPELKDYLPPEKSKRDWPHINTCEILPENPIGKKDKIFKKGNLLLCGAHADAIMVLDRGTENIVWVWGPGIIEGPHMPNMLPNGNLLIYDNGRYRGYTKIIELNPITKKIVWEYGSNKEFFSPARGSALRMGNGNTLTANSDNGWFFEVTPEGEKVWEYYNPDLTEKGDRMGLYRTLPYKKKLVDKLLKKHGKTYYERNNKSSFIKKAGLSDHLMEIIRRIESGYLDKAHTWLNQEGLETLSERERTFAYSFLYAVRKDIKRSLQNMKKSIEAGMPEMVFSIDFSDLFKPLTNHHDFIIDK